MLTIVDDERALAAAAAERITSLIEKSIRERHGAIVSLTGGSTPRLLYRYLGDPMQSWRARIDWSRVHLLWGDERHVPPDDPQSNFGMAHEALVNHVPIPAFQVHRMRGELINVNEAAREYESELEAAFLDANRSDRTFDVMLLGMGEDGHVASIFPGSPLLTGSPFEVALSVAAVWAPHLNAWRITLTPATLLNSRAIVMMVAGTAKADAVRWALEGPEQVDQHPAQLLRRVSDRVYWIIDQLAAGRLHAAPPG